MAAANDDDYVETTHGVIRPRSTAGSVAKRVIHENIVYQLEYRRCYKRPGKGRPRGCRCMRAKSPLDWHGPYPFAYTTARRRGGDVATTGGWKRLKVFPAEGYALLGLDPPG